MVRQLPRLSGAVGLLGVLAGVTGTLLHAANSAAGRGVQPSFFGMALCAAVGYGVIAYVLRHLPSPALPRVSAAIALTQGMALLASEWALLGPNTPGREWTTWVGSWLWATGFSLLLTTLPLLLPDGRVAPRWGAARWLAAVTVLWTSTSWALTPYEKQDFPGIYGELTNPLGVLAAASPLAVAAGLVLLVGSALVALVSLVDRFRRAAAVERQQIKWALVGATTAALLVVLALLAPVGVGQALIAAATLPIPVTIAVAALRSRLWDVDVVISRGLVTVGVAALAVVACALAVWALARAVGDGSVAVGPSAAAAAVVVLVVAPLRERLQALVNRLVHGDSSEPHQLLARLGDRLGAAEDPDRLVTQALPSVVEQVRRGLHARHVALTLADGTRSESGVLDLDSPEVRVPLIHAGQPIGELALRRPGAFGRSDQRVLVTLGRQAAIAAHTVLLGGEARAARERAVLAREEERRRLRRDLHDDLGPSMAAVALQVETARDLIVVDPTAAAAVLDRLIPHIKEAVTGIRALVENLRPPMLDELGLAGALTELGERLQTARTGIVVTVCRPERAAAALADERLPAAVEVAAYRIAAEAMTNAVRHADASRVDVLIDHSDYGVRVSVLDDGRGIESVEAARGRTGVGLRSMSERAQELGGTVEVTSRPGAGTRVTAHVPVRPTPDRIGEAVPR